jgi:hypothetical protein
MERILLIHRPVETQGFLLSPGQFLYSVTEIPGLTLREFDSADRDRNDRLESGRFQIFVQRGVTNARALPSRLKSLPRLFRSGTLASVASR